MITTYDYIESNKRKTILLILLFPVSLMLVLFIVFCFALWCFPELRANNSPIVSQVIDSYWEIFIGCILLSIIWTTIAFYGGSNMIVGMVNATKLQDEPNTYSSDLKNFLEKFSITEDIPKAKISKEEIRKILENVSSKEKIPTPNLYIVKDEAELKPFSVGTIADSAVILTKNYIEMSDKSKIEAFITRQISIIILQDKKREAKRILENISITAGIPTPKFYILEDEKGLNAFATGTTEKNCAVILTRGLLETLDKSEIEAVIAHEIAHIIYQDTKLMMVITLLIGFFTYCGYLILRTLEFRDRRSRSSKKDSKAVFIILLIGVAFIIYGYVVAPLIRLAVSRTREFHADAKSALLTRNPQALISALRKIENYPIVSVLNSKYNSNELVAPMCIENPLRKKVSLFDSLSNLSSTHPPIEKRIQALEVMDGRSLFPY